MKVPKIQIEKPPKPGAQFRDLLKAISSHRNPGMNVHLHMHTNQDSTTTGLPHLGSVRNADDVA